MLVDTVVIGDTPFAVSAQNSLRALGLTSYLIYTGDIGVKYVISEDVQFPHVSCYYSLSFPDGGTWESRVLSSLYRKSFHDVLGGHSTFFYYLADAVESHRACLRVSAVVADRLTSRGGYVGTPAKIGMENKFVVLPDGEVIHYGKLVLCESLRSFLERVGTASKFLSGKSLGILVEESVSLLPPVVKLWGFHHAGMLPLASISRGFLQYHYFPEGRKANLSVQDYVKNRTCESREAILGLERKGVHAYGPRAMWDTGLTQNSELLRMRDEFQDLP